jgi:hypothetical protein
LDVIHIIGWEMILQEKITLTPGLDGWDVKDGKTCFYFGKGSIFRLPCSKNISDR